MFFFRKVAIGYLGTFNSCWDGKLFQKISTQDNLVLARCTRFNNWPCVAHWDQTKNVKNQLNQELGMERPHISYFLLFLKLDLLNFSSRDWIEDFADTF